MDGGTVSLPTLLDGVRDGIGCGCCSLGSPEEAKISAATIDEESKAHAATLRQLSAIAGDDSEMNAIADWLDGQTTPPKV